MATILNCWSPWQNNLYDPIQLQGGWEWQCHLVPELGTSRQLVNCTTIIFVTRKPTQDRVPSTDICVSCIPFSGLGRCMRMLACGLILQILCHLYSPGSFARKRSLWPFVRVCVCSPSVCDSSIFLHTAPPTARATPGQDLPVGLQGIRGWLPVRQSPA